MALNPQFINTPRIGIAEITSVLTSRATNASALDTVITGAAGGTRVLEVVVKGLGTTAASVIWLWLNNGTSNFLFDEILVPVVTGSNTVASSRIATGYANLLLPSATWSVRATLTVTPTAGNVLVEAFGGDLV